MTLSVMNVLTEVVQRDMCSGCGVCAGICPRRVLAMGLDAKGDLVPHLSAEECTSCGMCLAICPFAAGVHDPREINVAHFGVNAGDISTAFHEDVGWHHSALMGHSPRYRPTSASGGLATALLAELLRRGKVDAVGVVGQVITDHGVEFSFRKVTSVDDLVRCSGSVYHPVEVSGLLAEISQDAGMYWALVGVPCLCAALRAACAKRPALNRSVAYLLGLACGGYQNGMYTELLIRRSGFPPEAVTRVDFRVKATQGPASNYGFRAFGKGGSQGACIPYHGLPFYLGRNGYFRCNACNFCRDVFAETADVCFMDAWLPERRSDPESMSLVLVRNGELGSILESSADCDVHRIAIDRVVASQRGQISRKRVQIKMRLSPDGKGFSMAHRLAWALERATQRRSKRMWARFGRSGTTWCFWLVMADLIALTFAVQVAQKIWSRLRTIATSVL